MPALKRLFLIGLTIVACVPVAGRLFASSGVTATQVQQTVSNNNSWLVNEIAGNLLYAIASWFEIGLYLIWLVVTWCVIELYTLIGTYIIPIWDFSNGAGFFSLPTEVSAWSVVCVPAQASTLLWSVVPWLLGVCGLGIVTGAAIAIPRASLAGREPFEAVGGLVWATSLIVVFPLLYSVPIHVGNIIARGFYEVAAANVSSSTSGQNGLFNALLTNSLFPSSANTVSLGSPLSVASLANSVGGTNLSSLASTVSFGGNSVSQTAQIENTFTSMMNSMYGGNGTIQLSTNYALQGMSTILETYASRMIQIVLGIWGIVELIGVLVIKGGQVIAMILNFYLGWIACALYAFPETRAVFWGWLKAHTTLCLWGLIWALLIFIMNVIVAAGNGLQGMTTDATGVMIFQGVGLFLMPFILFGGIHKFKQIASIAGGLASTSQLAQAVGGAVSQGLKGGLNQIKDGSFPGPVMKGAQWGSAGAKAGGGLMDMSSMWGKGMASVANTASKALNVVPGVGPMAGAAVKAGASMGSSAANAAAQGVRYSNPFAGYQRLTSQQKTPPPRSTIGGPLFSRAKGPGQGGVPDMPDA